MMNQDVYNSTYLSCYDDLALDSVCIPEPKRSKLARWVTDATGQEYSKYLGINREDSAVRLQLHHAIRDRVIVMNQDEGFIFIPIILGAILSWLIQRLLDKLFPKKPT